MFKWPFQYIGRFHADFYYNCGTFFYNFILNDLKEILGFDKKGTFSSRFFLKDCLIKVTIILSSEPFKPLPCMIKNGRENPSIFSSISIYRKRFKGFSKKVLFSTKYESADIPKAIFEFCLFFIHYHKCMLVQF